MEGFLRLVGYPRVNCPELESAFETIYDSQLGWAYKPLQKYTKKFGGVYIINSEGYRAESIFQKTDFTKPIILLVGDSFLFGHGLNFNETFGYKLQQLLGDKYEVINYSVQGYGTDQIYLLTQKLLKTYHPVAVITDYIPDHDLRNVTRDVRNLNRCVAFVATKPLFVSINGKPKQVAYPITYQEYDKIKFIALVRGLMQGNLEKKAETYGHELSQQLIAETKDQVESTGAMFYIIDYENILAANEDFDKRVLGISTDPNNQLQLHIPSDIFHPNALANSIIVETFLKKFGNDFN